LYYSIALDSTDISTSSKSKASASINDVKTYNKKILNDKIRRLIVANIQLIIDKIETEKTRVNLETDKTRLFDEKNSLIVKKEKLRTEIVILNIAGSSNISIRGY